MYKIAGLIFFSIFFCNAMAQQKYWQQQVNYTIAVTLNDKEKTLDGVEKITYINNSPDTLHYLWIHLWMNAYKNDKTAFSEQQLANGNTQFYFSKDADKGYINRLNFRTENKTLTQTDHPYYIDIVKIELAEPLLPNATTVISTPFHVKLPYNFSRGGYVGNSFQVTQWFPKVAMYDATGWHEMPYLDQGEYYSNFGDYDVQITLPENYVVAATGEVSQVGQMGQMSQMSQGVLLPSPFGEGLGVRPGEGLEVRPGEGNSVMLKKNTTKKNTTKKKVIVKNVTPIKLPEQNIANKTLTYKQQNVVDFAWFADKNFIYKTDTLLLPNGHIIQCQSYYTKKTETLWGNSLQYMKRALLYRSKVIGNYPFNTATIVAAPMGFAGGMEYPTITSIAGNYSPKSLEMVIEHELGHNWFQGILASNERDNPWLDEGLNTYYDYRYENEYFNTTVKKSKRKLTLLPQLNIEEYTVMAALHKDQPIQTSSANFTQANYNYIAYNKTAKWLQQLQLQIGTAAMDSAMQSYYAQWQFKHPQPKDFDAIMNNIGITNNDFAAVRNSTGFLKKEQLQKGASLVLPLFGYNKYNGILFGIGVHNYKANNAPLRYFALPMFGTKTKDVNGYARVVYNYYPKNKALARIDVGVNASKFGQNSFVEGNETLQLGFAKIVPFVRLTLKNKTATSPYVKAIQLKSYQIAEDNLQFVRVDNAPIDTFFKAIKVKNKYYVNQLQLSIQKNTALYPYTMQLQLEQVKDLLRTTFSYNQYFNYNQKQGLQFRFFAGKINYLKAKTNTLQFANDRYVLNLLAPKGAEDYTYSTYFTGRNQFDKFSSYQILQRDGFFKFRTDLLANKIGRTDNWISSINLVSDVPNAINPLQALPIKVPLKLFVDIGTYAEVWKKNNTDQKFIFDAGISLSLFKGLIELYAPLLYSKPFAEYSQQLWGKKRSFKNYAFSINFNAFKLHTYIPQINW